LNGKKTENSGWAQNSPDECKLDVFSILNESWHLCSVFLCHDTADGNELCNLLYHHHHRHHYITVHPDSHLHVRIQSVLQIFLQA